MLLTCIIKYSLVLLMMDRSNSNTINTASSRLNHTPCESKSISEKELFELFTNLSKYISQLNVNLETPSNYFTLYIKISEKVAKNKRELSKKANSISLKKLYYLAYTDSRSLSRIYLLAIIGSLYPVTDSSSQKTMEQQRITQILNDQLVFLNKTVSHISAFFARYFTFTSFKNHFSKLNSNVAVSFLLSNLISMNNTLKVINQDNPNNKEEVKTLTCLIEENINLLFSLKDMMNCEFFRTQILSSLISLVYNNQDKTYQEYIIDWIISGLFEEYILISLEPLLNILLPLYHEIDPNIHKKVKRILDRILNYFKCNCDPNPKQLIDDLNTRYKYIFDYLHSILKKASELIEIKPFTELVESYVHFTIYSSPHECKAKILNNIFKELDSYFSNYRKLNQNIPQEVIKLYGKICSCIFKSDVKIFEVEILISMTTEFDPDNVLKYCCYILREIVKNKIEINTSEKMNIVIEILKKLLNHKKTEEVNEQKIIIQIMGLIHNSNPEKQFEMFLMMKNIYEKKYSQITKISLPSFFNTLLQLIKKCEVGYLKQLNSTKTITDYYNGLDMSTYTEDKLVDLLIIIYTFIKDSFTTTFIYYPETNLNFIPSVIQQIEKIEIARDKYGEICCSFIRTFISILIKDITDNTAKLQHMKELISIVSHLTILPKKLYEKIVYTITQAARSFQKRNDTTILSIAICDLYDNSILTDYSKIIASFEFAKREAEFCLAKIENLHLFIIILNKLLYYIDRGETFISVDFVNSIIEIIKQNVNMLIKECPENGKQIEKNFATIQEHIEIMKKESKIEIYDYINV